MPNETATTISILLIDEQKSRRLLLSDALKYYGYDIVKQLNDCQNLLDDVQQYNPAIIVIGTDMPNEHTLQQLYLLNNLSPRPVIMFAESHSPEVVKSIIKAGVTTYIVNDIQPSRLKSIIDVAYARFSELSALKSELDQTRIQLENRKVLERAKGLLMQNKAISEDDAYKTLRKMAMDKGQTLAEVSKNVIDVCQLLT